MITVNNTIWKRKHGPTVFSEFLIHTEQHVTDSSNLVRIIDIKEVTCTSSYIPVVFFCSLT